MGTKSLFSGKISNTECVLKSGIIEEQNEFVRNDATEGGVIPYCNELYKGYMCLKTAYRAGSQLTVQPDFARRQKLQRQGNNMVGTGWEMRG